MCSRIALRSELSSCEIEFSAAPDAVPAAAFASSCFSSHSWTLGSASNVSSSWTFDDVASSLTGAALGDLFAPPPCDLSTVDGLLDALGGNKRVAQLASVGISAISNWRSHRAIPPHLYFALEAVGKARGIPVDPGLFRRVRAPHLAEVIEGAP